MAVRDKIARFSLILNKLKRKSASFDEILDYLTLESELQGYDFIISKRTFQRDVQEILSLYGIEIVCDRISREYSIISGDLDFYNERVFEAFDVINTLRINERNSELIHIENRRSLGTEHLFGLLHAIKNKFIVRFTYHNYWKNEFSNREVHCFALKEFRNRWYVLARDQKDKIIKRFALDRMSELEITRTKFKNETNFNVSKYYNYSFGIIGPSGAETTEPEEVILSFTNYQGHYIKSLPLHHSQQVLVDNAKEFRIKLKLFVTEDFKMELLSYSRNLTIIKPQSLVSEIKGILERGLERYS